MMGMYRAGMFLTFRLDIAPDQGVAGTTWLIYRQAKKKRVQATLVLLVQLKLLIPEKKYLQTVILIQTTLNKPFFHII